MEEEYAEYEERVKNMINEVEKHVKEPAKAINDEDELTTVTSVIIFCNYKSTYMYTVCTKNTAHQQIQLLTQLIKYSINTINTCTTCNSKIECHTHVY